MMPHELSLRGIAKYLVGLLLLTSIFANAAPGDLKLEIMASTGDENLIAGFDSITSFEYFVSLDSAPIAIDEFGFISFAANVNVGGEPEYGFYQAFRPGMVSTILQSDSVAPGMIAKSPSSPDGIRTLNLNATPNRGFAMSPGGTSHALTFWTEFDGIFLYGADSGVVDDRPTTWPDRNFDSHNYWVAAAISDGRGTTKIRGGGTGPDMVVADNGATFWSTGNAILRSLAPGEISAVMFIDTPAPGFDPAENAMLDSRVGFRGIDDLENAIFHCRVATASGFSNAVYRQNRSDNSLVLLHASGFTTLPGGEGLEGSTGNVEAEDVFVTKDGSVYLRAGTSTTGEGFWRITYDQDGTLAKELLKSFSTNGLSETNTDLGMIRFRSINRGDWAVSENGTIYFSADVAGDEGESTSALEGIWKIDPTDQSIKTVARFGQNADPGNTDATYEWFYDLTAAGDDKLAFIALLSDGNRGLFGADESGGIVQIAIEGSPLVACEDPQDTSLECETVTLIEFTPDHAGEELNYSKGTPGLNKFGELAFLATLESGTTALVKAKFEGEERPVGTTFIWDGGAGTNDWHTITDGRSNWTDIAGVPWDKVPGSIGNEKVFVTTGSNVELKANVSIRELTLDVSTLTLSSALEFTHFFKGAEGSVLNLEAGSQITSDGDFTTSGAIVKNGAGAATVKIDDFEVNGGSVTLKSGTLNFENTISNFVDADVVVEGGLFAFDENVTAFRGAGSSLTVKSGVVNLDVFALSFEDNIQLNAESSGTIKIGRSGQSGAASIQLRSGGSTEPRSLVLMGDGTFELRRDIEFRDGDSFINDHKGAEGTGLFINIVGDEALTVPNNVSFINKGRLILQDGGLRYASEPNESGRIENSGILVIPARSAIDGFDCENKLNIILEGDASYGSLEFAERSMLRTRGGSLQPLDPASSQFRFEKNSKIIGVSEESSVTFPTDSDMSFEGEVEVREGAVLNIVSVSVHLPTTIEVEKDGELSLEDFKFFDVKINGEGSVRLTGVVEPAVETFSRLTIATIRSDFKDVDFKPNLKSTSLSFEPFRKAGAPSFDRTDSNAIFDNVFVREGVYVFVDAGVRLKIETPLILSSTLDVDGILEIAASITTGVEGGLISLGNVAAMDSSGEDIATIEISPSLSESILVDPGLLLTTTSSL